LNNDEKYEAEINSMDEYTYQWLPENYSDPSEPILKITKSSLGSFLWCPKKYEFSYIERRPIDQSEAMRKGTIMHNAREDFFNTFDVKKAENMTSDEVIDYCSSLFPLTIMLTWLSLKRKGSLSLVKKENCMSFYLLVMKANLIVKSLLKQTPTLSFLFKETTRYIFKELLTESFKKKLATSLWSLRQGLGKTTRRQ